MIWTTLFNYVTLKVRVVAENYNGPHNAAQPTVASFSNFFK